MILKNKKGDIINPVEDKKYKLRTGVYDYEINEEGYKTVQNRIGILEDTIITIELESNLKLVSFADGTDEEIAAMIEAHYAGDIDISEYWAVGDTRLMHLNEIPAGNGNSNKHTAQNITMAIIGIEHDDLKEAINGKTKAAVTIQCRETLGNNGIAEQDYYWGKSKDTFFREDNWSNNPIRNWFNNTFVNALPEKLKINVKTVIKKNIPYHSMNPGDSFITTDDKAFWLSYPEVLGNEKSQYDYYTGNDYKDATTLEGNQYEYYKISSNRIKYINNQGKKGQAENWWLRSPGMYSGTEWLRINTSGKIYFSYNGALGTAPAFCL